MGEASAGRSATSPTFFKSTSVRTRIEWQNSQVVWTALDQRNFTGAPQLGQFAVGELIDYSQPSCSYLIGPLHLAYRDPDGVEADFQKRLKIGGPARPAAEYIQTKRFVLRERVARQVRFGEQAHSSDPAGVGELMPGSFAERMKIHRGDDQPEQFFQALLVH